MSGSKAYVSTANRYTFRAAFLLAKPRLHTTVTQSSRYAPVAPPALCIPLKSPVNRARHAARYVESPPESEDEKAALAQLLDACLSGDSGLHGELYVSYETIGVKNPYLSQVRDNTFKCVSCQRRSTNSSV